MLSLIYKCFRIRTQLQSSQSEVIPIRENGCSPERVQTLRVWGPSVWGFVYFDHLQGFLLPSDRRYARWAWVSYFFLKPSKVRFTALSITETLYLIRLRQQWSACVPVSYVKSKEVRTTAYVHKGDPGQSWTISSSGHNNWSQDIWKRHFFGWVLEWLAQNMFCSRITWTLRKFHCWASDGFPDMEHGHPPPC